MRALYTWYEDHHRTLPWRETREPYPIWLSEIMLQQTRVETVLPYYARFLARFPTVASLAAAPEAAVLKLWEGLGYYSRARNLRRAAQQIVAEHSGRFPAQLDAVTALPGIGRSTAGAILSAAFGQAQPVLDGNVRRVLIRLEGLAGDPRKAAVVNRLWQLAQGLVEKAPDPGLHNQALMELGAVLCTPRQPACGPCPLRSRCHARAAGTQAQLPTRVPRRRLPHHDIAVGVLVRNGRLFIQQRPSHGLLGGLWEFPGGKQEAGETPPQTVVREMQEELGITVRVGAEIATVQHAYSHFRITLRAFWCTLSDASAQPHPTAAQDAAWVVPDTLTQYAFPRANQIVLEKVLEELTGG